MAKKKIIIEGERKLAEYFFNREFQITSLSLIKTDLDEGRAEILYPSESKLKEEATKEGYDTFASYMDDFVLNHYPMWGYVFLANRFFIDSVYMNVDKLYDLGIGVIDHETGYYLFIAGAGYDFYEAHWIPLFKELNWI